MRSRSRPEDLPQLGGRGLLELIIPALPRRLVRPPALERRRVPEAIALQMVVRHLADALDAQGLPAQVLAAVPARARSRHALVARPVRPFAPGMVLRRALAQRRQLLHQLAPARRGEGRGDADMVKLALRIVEAEEQGTHHGARPVLVPAESGHDAI